MKTIATFGFALFLAWIAVGLAAEPLASYLTAPRLEQSPMDTTVDDDYFQDSPPLVVRTASQVITRDTAGEIDGNNFAARARAAWTEDALFFRIDMRDDYFDPGSQGPIKQLKSDYIRLILRHQTAGPDARINAASWNIILLPNPSAGTVTAFSVAGEGLPPKPLGEIEARLIKEPTEPNAYSVLLSVQTGEWEDEPRLGAYTWLQVIWHDSDPQVQGPALSSSYCLFPARNDMTPAAESAGRLHYADTAWVGLVPTAPVFTGNTVRFLLNYGNLGLTPMRGEIYLYDRQNQVTIDGIRHDFTLEEGRVDNRIPVELDVTGLERGLYEVRTRAARVDGGILLAPGLLVVQRAAELSVFPQLVELKDREEGPIRELQAANDAQLARRTIEHLAGAGRVIWQAGIYDASYREFSGHIRGPGKVDIALPNTDARGIPWALWGGRDTLDGFGEPVVLDIDAALFQGGQDLSPYLPPFAHLQENLDAKRAANASVRLLLIGLIQDEVAAGGVPEIVVKAGDRVITRQKLRPSTPGTGTRHVYVMRVWLRPGQRQISIENVARYAPKVKFDFLALLDGVERPLSADEPSLVFSGAGSATVFNRQLQVGLHLLENYLVDKFFQVHPSLPGGKETVMTESDYALALNELAAWGRLRLASQLAATSTTRRFGAFGAGSRRTIGTPHMVVGLYNVWRRRGYDRDWMQRLWLPTVHRPMVEMEGEVTTNGLGLVNATGEFGLSPDGRRGTTLPMTLATRAAFESANDMARNLGIGGADSWGTTGERVNSGFNQYFIAPAGGVGVRGHLVGGAVPPNAWVYARYEDGQAVAVDDGERIFDSPKIFSGLYYWFDYNGFSLDPKTRQQVDATLTWLLTTSPVFQDPYFAKYRAITDTPACAQLWTAAAALLTSNHQLGSNLINGYIAYNFDEYLPFAFLENGNYDFAEVSAYTWEEKMNPGPNGVNRGPTEDDLSVLSATTGLKTARLLAGIDDYDGEVLRLIPRLPAGWGRVEASDWPIVHDYVGGRTTTIDYSYERLEAGTYILKLECPERLETVEVRMGPFELGKSRININANGEQRQVRSERDGDGMYIDYTFRKVNQITFTASPAF